MRKMRLTYSFWFLFSILDDCYFKCYEDDLGGLLGAINPHLWIDSLPMDMAIVSDWNSLCENQGFCEENAVDCVVSFLELCENKYGFSFTKAKKETRRFQQDEIVAFHKKADQLTKDNEAARDR